MSKAVWAYGGEVIARGVNSKTEFARLVQKERDFSIAGALGLNDRDLLGDVVRKLGRVEAFTLSVSHYRMEEWDGSQMFVCALDDRPGRGWVKVLIAHPNRDEAVSS